MNSILVWWLRRMTEFLKRFTWVRVGIIIFGIINPILTYTVNPEYTIFNAAILIASVLGVIYIILKIVFDKDPDKTW
jgi:predicted membrane channel-forming protein YqfA (hemolysin III family)